jgi:hypothetical protein
MLFFTAAAMLSGCSDDDSGEPQDQDNLPPDELSQVTVEIDHRVNGEPLVFGQQAWYRNAQGDSFQVNTFQYYLSNLVLLGEGTTPDFEEVFSYHFIDAREAERRRFAINEVPEGRYRGLRFRLGLDSAKNMAQDKIDTGDLSPVYGMFWEWATGYIFFKLEGNSPQSETGSIVFHIGGSGEHEASRVLEFTFDEPMVIDAETPRRRLRLEADLAEAFVDPDTIAFSRFNGTMSVGPQAARVADHYATMFSFQAQEVP